MKSQSNAAVARRRQSPQLEQHVMADEFNIFSDATTDQPVMVSTRHIRCVRESKPDGPVMIEFDAGHMVAVTATMTQVEMALGIEI